MVEIAAQKSESLEVGSTMTHFYLAVALSLIGVGVSLVRTVRVGALVSMPVLLCAGTFLFLFVKPLAQPDALTMEVSFNSDLVWLMLVLLLCAMFGNVRSVQARSDRRALNVGLGWVWGGAVLYAFYCLLGMWRAYRASGSVVALLTANRVTAYLAESYLNPTPVWELLADYCGQGFFLILVARYWREGRRGTAVALYLLPLLRLLATANTRFLITALIVSFIVFVAGTPKPARDGRKSRLGALRSPAIWASIVAVGIGWAYVGSFVRGGWFGEAGGDAKFMDRRLLEEIVLRDIDYYQWLHDVHLAVDGGVLERERGRGWLTYNAATFVPRAWWPEKPIVAASPRLTEQLIGPLGAGMPVTTYTIFGEGYWQFGLLGMCVSPLLFLGLHSVLLTRLQFVSDAGLWAIYLAFVSLAKLRAELPIVPITVQWLTLMVAIVSTWWFRRRALAR